MQKVRDGRYVRTTLVDEYRVTTFHEVDNLDTKKVENAENNYEETFIRIREILQDKPWCCDSEDDILFICQTVTDALKENLLLRKDTK